VITDPVGIKPGGACAAVDPDTVTCPGAAIASVVVNAGGANDSIVLDRATWPVAIEGDLDGGSGDDRITSAGGADAVAGGSGRDILDGGAGSDDLRGGSNDDVLYYGDRTAPLSVTVSTGNDNDGDITDATGNSRDTVHGDFETVIGGAANDTLIGDSSAETLYGGAGDDALFGGRGGDVLAGADGADFLSGDSGNDLVRGNAGPDRALGGDGEDRVKGGPDNDLVRGGPGVDVMKGQGGIDVLQARDGFTDRRINCGPGPNGREFATRDRRLDPKPKSC
jgi:Ca2+-binding RTX toxin-like protein